MEESAPVTTIDPVFAPHLDALKRCGSCGFQFMQVPDAIYGFRERMGALDVLLVHDLADARAARFKSDDLHRHEFPRALWSTGGEVADVVVELLSLPPHGSPGAPQLARVYSDLWLP